MINGVINVTSWPQVVLVCLFVAPSALFLSPLLRDYYTLNPKT